MLGLLLVCWLGCWVPAPVWAATVPSDRPELTLELLQERLKSPMQSEGGRVLDLRHLIIDLRPENGDLRDQFYERLQTQLQRSGTPLGLDLSYSQIKGELVLSKLGLRTPLYGKALSPIFSEAEQIQLQRDRRRLSQLRQLSQSLLTTPGGNGQLTPPSQITVFRGPLKLVQTRFEGAVNASNTFFLNRVEAPGADFTQEVDCSETRFSQPVNFTSAVFRRDLRFRNSIFFAKAGFSQDQFQGVANFQGSEFQAAVRFNQGRFQQLANFSRTQWQGTADFSQTQWQNTAMFTKARFLQPLFLTEAVFEQTLLLREAQFNHPVNLRGAQILNRADFSYGSFGKAAYLNISGLEFDADQAKILGDPGQIGRVLSAPLLSGNETLFRNLIQNFRQLQQIADANQVEYSMQQLRLRELSQRFLGTNLNTATLNQLGRLGFSTVQATQIIQTRSRHSFRSLTELLSLETVDFATLIRVRTRAIAEEPLPPIWNLSRRIGWGWQWLGLSLLLLLSRYGSSFGLVFGVGMLAIAYFGLLFWVLDRWRRFRHPPVIPTVFESAWVLISGGLLTLTAVSAIARTATQPGWTLFCLGVMTLPLPLLMVVRIYQQGRYHDQMAVSYFVEEGTLRQLRLLIGRLPTIPRYPLFRERYLPLLWNRRWNWLNYYDFSLNNFVKLGFNDIRLRDEHLPGLISALVWYQWSLGLLYIALLLWTLSRTIPGLNLLIYLK
ncbi:hypothetical protein DO97_14450 [Neosynechococcus sphagnicola sy1]|uniref:Low-complexity protein n=2 Tax=Neosynechococcus TaxID=1501143 RepID=A0A098TH36_9CYAN|nr:hypothetical protein DO97_14450 [Neosynechococcus sphagnicola sy1]